MKKTASKKPAKKTAAKKAAPAKKTAAPLPQPELPLNADDGAPEPVNDAAAKRAPDSRLPAARESVRRLAICGRKLAIAETVKALDAPEWLVARAFAEELREARESIGLPAIRSRAKAAV